MSENTRYYRKILRSKGLIYLAGEELEITIKNFSVTGLLIELLPNPVIKTVGELFKAIELTSSIVDLYLPEMRLAGEARFARADMADGQLLLALEFVHIAYDINAVFYQRKVYRKSLEAVGHLSLQGKKHAFKTINVSVEGLMVYLEGKISVEPGFVTAFEFSRLNLLGEIEVIWVEDDPSGGTLMGLHYLHMENSKINGIPSFAQAIAEKNEAA